MTSVGQFRAPKNPPRNTHRSRSYQDTDAVSRSGFETAGCPADDNNLSCQFQRGRRNDIGVGTDVSAQFRECRRQLGQ